MLRAWFDDLPGWGTSLIVHLSLLLVLGLWIVPAEVPFTAAMLDAVEGKPVEEFDIMSVDQMCDPSCGIACRLPPPAGTWNFVHEAPDFAQDVIDDMFRPVDYVAVPESEPDLQIATFPGIEFDGPRHVLVNNSQLGGPGITSRGRVARSKLVKRTGGNAASEQAVALALRWLAAHQLPDGGWDLDHSQGPGVRSRKDPGEKDSRNGATALALLPFLGAGQTHKEGSYQKAVGAGLGYLARSIKLDPSGGALNDGGLNDGGMMYAHGLGAIALCEAYAMTKDGGIAGPAQATLNFISSSQDPKGGGWRYAPRQAGDTSVFGWQVMALKSGHLAYLQVPHATITKAATFLDSVQTDNGSAYGYATPGAGMATSSIGLLCRMYLGWKRDEPALQRGVAKLAERGPSKSDFYYNYYATQVMFQYHSGEGPAWEKWNQQLRDWLVESQGKQGTETGSWYTDGGHSNKAGGRLFCTALACMTLEVYYRHMPIYAHQAVEEDFPD